MTIQTIIGPAKRLDRVRVVSDFTDEVSLTQQHFKDDVDINNIVRKYAQDGLMPLAKKQQQFGYATSQTFTEAMFTVATAEEEFMQLPSEVRSHFNNDVAAYLDAASDETQRPLFEELGMLEPLPDQERETVPTEPPAATPAAETAPQ